MRTYLGSVLEMNGKGVEVLLDPVTLEIIAMFNNGKLLTSYNDYRILVQDEPTAVPMFPH